MGLRVTILLLWQSAIVILVYSSVLRCLSTIVSEVIISQIKYINFDSNFSLKLVYIESFESFVEIGFFTLIR